MSLSKESIEKFKEIFKKEYGKELSDQEAYESATNLMGFAEVLYEFAKKEYQRKQQLKKEPDENGVNSRAKFSSITRAKRRVKMNENFIDFKLNFQFLFVKQSPTK